MDGKVASITRRSIASPRASTSPIRPTKMSTSWTRRPIASFGQSTGRRVAPACPRWAVYDGRTAPSSLTIADPPLILEIDAKTPSKMMEKYKVPATGPHGLDLDPQGRQLFCACDTAKLVAVDLNSSEIRAVGELSGPPDVVFFNSRLNHVYVAVGTPGVIEVFDARRMKLLERVTTEKGAHTLAFDQRKNKVYAFLPATHRAAVYQDG